MLNFNLGFIVGQNELISRRLRACMEQIEKGHISIDSDNNPILLGISSIELNLNTVKDALETLQENLNTLMEQRYTKKCARIMSEDKSILSMVQGSLMKTESIAQLISYYLKKDGKYDQ